MDLLNFGKKRGTYQFSEDLFHDNYIPQITLLTRVTNKWLATINNNTFVNTKVHKQTSANMTTSISYQLH